jgi:hypothetical protein
MRRVLATALAALSAVGVGIAHEAGAFLHPHPPMPPGPTGGLTHLRPPGPTGGLTHLQPPGPTGGLTHLQPPGPTGGLTHLQPPGPTGEPPLRPIDPPVPSGTIGEVKRDASDPEVRRVLCFAYQQFYDPSTNSVRLPSEDGVLTSLAGRLLPATTADRISGVLQTSETRLRSLSDGDLHEVFASLACG